MSIDKRREKQKMWKRNANRNESKKRKLKEIFFSCLNYDELIAFDNEKKIRHGTGGKWQRIATVWRDVAAFAAAHSAHDDEMPFVVCCTFIIFTLRSFCCFVFVIVVSSCIPLNSISLARWCWCRSLFIPASTFHVWVDGERRRRAANDGEDDCVSLLMLN